MKFKILFFLFFSVLLSLVTQAQILRKGPIIICPADPASYDTRVPVREDLSHLVNRSSLRVEASEEFKSNIVVNYNGFTEEAKTAFQFAVDIWASLISSDVDIVIDANFTNLGEGVLGAAGSSYFVRDFKNAPSDTTFYPIALAEKIAGEQLNLPGEPEISCSFSSAFDFYFGTDGNPPSDKYDFVTIVLHELGHGLGFAGTEFVDDNGIGSWDYFSNKTARYNQFVELNDGTSLLNLPNNTEETADALTGGSLFFNGALSVASLGQRPKLYAPFTYDGGSSFSHLDEASFPAGNLNSLMSPRVGAGESILDPGVSLDIFADMGWFLTVIEHDVKYPVIDNLVDDIIVEASIRTDTNIVTNNLKVVYSSDDFTTSNEILLNQNPDGSYTASIPNPGVEGVLRYYLDGIEDGLGRQVRSPLNQQSYSVLIKEIPVMTVPFNLSSGNFENGNAGFFSHPILGETDLWELGQPTNVLTTSSTPNAVWKTKLNGNISYDDVAYKCALVSPYFDLSDAQANYRLNFELAMDLAGTGTNLFESGPIGANVEFSLDGGLTWSVLGSTFDPAASNWYNFQNEGGGTFSTNLFDNEPGWVIDSVNVVNVDYNISRFAGNDSVAFRVVFHVESDFISDGYESDGILVDNFQIIKEAPIADFILTNNQSIFFAGQSIEFEFISSGATSFSWDFGDGSTSIEENPVHQYTEGGVYDVSLSINYPGGTSSVLKENFVTIVATAGSNFTLADGGDFEVDNNMFIAENVSGTGFERGKSTINGKNGTSSGDFAWVTGLTDNEYLDRSEAFLYTPVFDLSSLGNYILSFKANYKTEAGWDGFIIEYTVNNGVSWNQLKPQIRSDWYNQVGEDNGAQGWPAIPLFTGTTNGEFVQKTTNISDLGGVGQVGFRFHWLSDYASTDVGIAIDDFELEGPVAGAAVPEFSILNYSGCDGQVVTFYNESTGSISSMTWDFGANATPPSATGIGPHTVTYSGEGASTVTLTVISPVNGELTEQKIDLIESSPAHQPLVTVESNGDGTYTLTSSVGDSYQWLRDDVPLEGEIGQSIQASLGDGGEYSVLVTIGSCTVETTPQIVDGVLEERVLIYPNPTSDYVYLESSVSLVGKYSLITLSGKVLEKGLINGSALMVDLSRYKKGIYLLKIETKEDSRLIKILVDK